MLAKTVNTKAPPVDFDSTWDLCRFKLQRVENYVDTDNTEARDLFSKEEYLEIFSLLYNICTTKTATNTSFINSQKLYNKHGDLFSIFFTNRAHILLDCKREDEMLLYFVSHSDHHVVMNKWYSALFMYLDRSYTRYNNVPSLSDAGRNIFKAAFFDVVKTSVVQEILRQLQVERENGVIYRDLIQRCINVFFYVDGKNAFELEVEPFFLEERRQMYKRQSLLWLQDKPVPVYIHLSDEQMQKDANQCDLFFPESTKTKLLKLCKNEFFETQYAELINHPVSGYRFMLGTNKNNEVTHLFRTFAAVPVALELMASIFKQHVVDLFAEFWRTRLVKTEVSEKDNTEDPAFVIEIFAMCKTQYNLVTGCHDGDMNFQKAFKSAMTIAMHNNHSSEPGKMVNILTTFCDSLLKKGGLKLDDDQVEYYLQCSVELIEFLNDKDLFAELHRQLMAKRMLNQRSASFEMEKFVVSKLKLNYGQRYTGKIEGMLTDILMEKEDDVQFGRFCEEQNAPVPFDFKVLTLSAGLWPHYTPVDELVLPPIMYSAMTEFNKFYCSKHVSHKLKFVHSLGNMVIKASFEKKTYDLQVSVLQAAVLMVFNHEHITHVPFTELLKTINVSESILKKIVHSLSCGKHKILNRIDGNSKEESTDKVIRNTDLFSVNVMFKCPLKMIALPMPSIEPVNNTTGSKLMEQDRAFTIDAAVVRIMKARKTMQHQSLVGEVLSQIRVFMPDAKAVKKSIESLIEREYLERDAEEPGLYKYLT